MRKRLAAGAILSVLAAAGQAAQEPPRPAFRAGVDLITVDVSATDGSGRPVTDLRARDFTVKVDGKTRDVVSAELVKVDPSAPPPAPLRGSLSSLISTNANPATGRRVIVGVDQTLITPGSITPLLRTAGRFVDGLLPQDHAAFVAFPEPGPRVEFTLDKARVREAMQGIVGQPGKGLMKSFEMSLTEAFEINGRERVFNTSLDGVAGLGPAARRVIERGCRGLTFEELQKDVTTLSLCIKELINEAVVVTVEARTNAGISIGALERMLSELAPVEGSKSLVLFSAGLLLEDPVALDRAVRLAAEARTSVTVIAVDPVRESDTLALGGPPPSALQDRSLELAGLQDIADRTGGRFVRVVGGNAQGVFDRIATELSAWYVVAVERQKGDPDRQRVEVEIKRRGVTVRSNRTFVATAAINAARPRADVLRDALSSPIPVGGLPLRVSTFAQRDSEAPTYRLHVAADIGQPGAPEGEFSVGYLLMTEQGKVVASLGRQLKLAPAPGGREPIHFDTAFTVDPGVYLLRFGVVDPEGRRGTVVHRVELGPLTRDTLKTSDLIVGNVPGEGETMHPGVEPHVTGGRVAAYLELYLGEADPGGLSAILEIGEGEASPALVTASLNLGAGARADWLVASGAIEAGLLPGRYLARASIRRGGETVTTLSRPFVLERNENPVSRRDGNARPAPLSPETPRRAGAYVSTVIGALTNVVAQEEFVLSDPDRRVTSDFLLVRYPGSERDLLTYRDVIRVNGADLADREGRVMDLFLKPTGSLRERVTRISLAAEAHVPPTLNPIFALGFLQADFQARFAFSAVEAGSEWPGGVRAVSFVETARPTLLRAGPLGTIDMPSRGTVWLEEATGRILQTELVIGTGRSAARVTTRFRVDDRLQITVPEVMRTQNPSAVATYSNFRRFNVQSDTELAPPQR